MILLHLLKRLRKGMLNISEPKILDIMKDCDHFYIDKELEIANKILKFFNLNRSNITRKRTKK